MKLGIPLATFLKREINKVVFGNLIDYEGLIKSLLEFNTDIIAAIVVTEQGKIAHKTDNWGSIPDLEQLIQMWGSTVEKSNPEKVKMYGSITNVPSAITLNGVKFSTIQLSDKILILKSYDKSSYLLGVRKQDTVLLAKVLYETNTKHALFDVQRTVEKMFPTELGRSKLVEKEKKEEKVLREKVSKKKESREFPSEDEIKKLAEMKPQGDRRIYLKNRLEQYKALFDVPIKSEEQEIIREIGKMIGKKIKLIPAEKIFESWLHFEDLFTSWKDLSYWRKMDLAPDEDFPAQNYQCHMMTMNGHVILLSLDGVGLAKLPKSLSKLNHLTYLSLPRNDITHIPPSIEELENLEYIYLQENHLTKLSPSVGKLPNLKVLDLRKNAIHDVWAPTRYNEHIQRIDLTENPVKLFQTRQSFRDLVDQDIILIDEFQLHDSVLDALNKTKK